MGIVKAGLKILVYLITILGYILLPIFLNFKGNIILSLILSLILIFSTIKIIKNIIKKEKGSKAKNILFCTLNLILIVIVGAITVTVVELYKEEDRSIALYAVLEKTEMEPEGYNDVFKKEEKENYKILYTEKLEPALNNINLILDRAIKLNNRIFGDFDKESVTIKFDYIKDVFEGRDSSEGSDGLYMPLTREIYVYGKDAYDDALSGGGSMKLQDSLIHEYTHHVMFEFFKVNDIDSKTIPLWFIEGVAEHVADTNYITEINEIVPFSKLVTTEQWENNLQKENTIYMQSKYAVRRIVILKGEDKLKDIILKSKESDFNTAFKEVVGISIEDLENIMNEDLKDNFTKQFHEFRNANKDIYEEEKIYLDKYMNEKEKALEKYISIDNNPDAYAHLARIYIGGDEYDKAEKLLKEGIEKNQDEAELYRELGLMYEEKNQLELAKECFKKEESLNKK
ncbi:tetratricopeptide repeat protein [Clostridium sardiniense]|uniref:tetratricopeptide repeat protein n=1 Tax=Clostridium sardiniense TaxID=29369 RepID=UPI003D32797C